MNQYDLDVFGKGHEYMTGGWIGDGNFKEQMNQTSRPNKRP